MSEKNSHVVAQMEKCYDVVLALQNLTFYLAGRAALTIEGPKVLAVVRDYCTVCFQRVVQHRCSITYSNSFPSTAEQPYKALGARALSAYEQVLIMDTMVGLLQTLKGMLSTLLHYFPDPAGKDISSALAIALDSEPISTLDAACAKISVIGRVKPDGLAVQKALQELADARKDTQVNDTTIAGLQRLFSAMLSVQVLLDQVHEILQALVNDRRDTWLPRASNVLDYANLVLAYQSELFLAAKLFADSFAKFGSKSASTRLTDLNSVYLPALADKLHQVVALYREK